jgi:hypothetical protein
VEFGRQNSQHPHAWGFVDQPVVLSRLFGPDGLRGQGVRVSWLLPTPFYADAQIGVLNSVGETTFSFRSEESGEIHGGEVSEREVEGVGDFLFVPRLAASLDLSPTQTVLFGASAAVGPNNAGSDTSTQIYGADLYWKWKSLTALRGFPFVSFQSEALLRRYETDERAAADEPSEMLPAETFEDRGVYAQLLWGIKPMWVAGLRTDFVDGDETAFEAEFRGERTRVSPSLTWYPSEFSKLRFQYNYDHRPDVGSDHSVWLQVEFILGAHASHQF